MDFYTYAWLREDGTPYYIGKGKNDRAFRKGGPERSRVLLLKQNCTEDEAFRHEKYMISVFGRKDIGTGILINLTEGGEGSSGYLHTEEAKQQMKGPKTDDHKQKLSEVRTKLWEDPEYRKKMTEINKRSRQEKEFKEKQRVAQLNRDPISNTKQKATKRKKWKREVWDLIEKAINSSSNYFWGRAEIEKTTGETKGIISSMAKLIRKGITWEQAMSGQS
jgi:hypothetical protein